MICPECGADMQPVNHNNRGPRCPSCWARVVVVEEAPPVMEPEQKAEASAPPKRRGKPKHEKSLTDITEEILKENADAWRKLAER